MPVYRYLALDVSGKKRTGTLSASTAVEARQRLRDQSWRIEQFEEGTSAGSGSGPLAFLGRMRPGSGSRRADLVAEFSRHLALLLRSGVPLAEALEVLANQQQRNGAGRAWTCVLGDLHDRVCQGRTLSEAMSDHPRWFGDLLVGAVRIGQTAGNLDEALTQVAAYLKDRRKLAGQLTNALIYPAILLTLGVAVVIFLMSYVIPQLMTVLEAGGRTLPASTRLLKSVSDALVTYWPVLLGASAAVLVGTLIALRNQRGELAWHRLQLRLPLIGSLLRKALVARFAQQMTVLLSTGVPFVEALATVRSQTRHRVLASELEEVERAVGAGSDIAPTLSGSRVFPPLVAHLVGVGQNAGELPEMLQQLRQGYEAEVELAVTRFTAALEPALIIVLAAMIGFIVFATMMPILEATRSMQR